MKLTSPIHTLKMQAKRLKREQSIKMVTALDLIARAEGFSSWSLLQTKAKDYSPKTADEILDYIYAGDLVLMAARPNLGKTKLALQVLLKAVEQDKSCFFFSLEYTHAQSIKKLTSLNTSFKPNESWLEIDCSDQISAGYVIAKTENMLTENSIIVVDYLQLLDQKREKPALQQQIETLKAYAKQRGCIIIFISQIDRRFEQDNRKRPTLDDIRLPNPLDLSLFNKAIFI
ncbi:MAG: DNA helicase [Alphaproteobacteria bacterium]|nr:DNA helicase [Alphaproteobacteria bacterium]